MITLYQVQVRMFEDKPSCMEALRVWYTARMKGKRDVLMLEMEKKGAEEDKYYG